MKVPGFRQADAMHQDQQAKPGRSLLSNLAPPDLENKVLTQSSSLISKPSADLPVQPHSCPSLQPSSLSSTTSTLLSTPSFSCSAPLTSHLLSTQNTLLNRGTLSLCPSLSPSTLPGPLLSTSLHTSNSGLFKGFSHPTPTSLLPTGLDGEREEERGDGGSAADCPPEADMISSSEKMSVVSDEDEESFGGEEEEEEEELEVELTSQLPVGDMDQTMEIKQQEFAEMERGKEELEEELKDKKYLLLNEVCCSLVNKNTPPGQRDWDSEDSMWTRIRSLAQDISDTDPQFLLKVAVYTRQELNIRITANFLLALAANQPSTKQHVRRYYCAAVQLPSDWLEVARIYSTCFSHNLPTCLKKAMADKFKQFNEYQLAKYNTRKQRCKHNSKRAKAKPQEITDRQLDEWAKWLRTDANNLKKFLKIEKRAVVDKKQSEFSLKKMITRLHIKEPAQHVMAILGRKYPGDVKAFSRSGLSGVWDRDKAGKRMKLKQPETWERLVSQQGNKASTWQQLIDNRSLPFMAMLRNLRNMITSGISEPHHQKILSRLTNKKAVIQSRQFPFRFLAAYKVIMELRNMVRASENITTSKEILKGIVKKVPRSRCFRQLDWDTVSRGKMRVSLKVPFVRRLYRLKKSQIERVRQRQFTVGLLDRYRQALETAVQISCCYNVPPLPGKTIIFLNGASYYYNDMSKLVDFCCPPCPNKYEEKAEEEEDEEETGDEGTEEEEEEEERRVEKGKKEEEEEANLTPSMQEVVVLLALMIAKSAEDAQLFSWRAWAEEYEEVKMKSNVLLENVHHIVKEIEGNNMKKVNNPGLSKKDKVDNIIILTDNQVCGEFKWLVENYRHNVNEKALVVKIFLSQCSSPSTPERNCVELNGFSEQILRFVTERGSSRLLDHVEHIDKLHSIPPPPGVKGPLTPAPIVPLPASPNLRWRGVRVFISSTFRDMHAERDVLVRSVFPELRRRAAQHCLYLQEVELRWGVTEEESERAAALCLSEVCRSQMLVGVLGERYGQVPPRPALPDLPQYSWLASAPAGLSITEMEIRQFQSLYPDTIQERMFCYFRDPNLAKSVPVAWRSDFAPESKEAEAKMADLKRWILNSGVKVTENYPCEWGGVVDRKAYLKGLEEFGKAVLEDLWAAVLKQFVEENQDTEARADVREQEVQQGALQRQFYGRAKLLTSAMEKLQLAQAGGGILLMEGSPGEGKTVFMAALAGALRAPDVSKRQRGCDVISYSTAASQSAHSVENLLRCLVHWFNRRKETGEALPIPSSYKDLLAEFHSRLNDIKKSQPLALLVDGADLIQDSRGQLCSDWIPQQLPQGLCLVLSVTSNSALLRLLAKRKGSSVLALGELSLMDRKEIVQKGLDDFGKKLSDSAFNNQLQILLMKKGAISPLYLHLACEDLRNFASFDKIKESLQGLPQSLSQLVQHSVARLQSQYRGVTGLRWALATLTVSTAGLRERELYAVLNTCNDLPPSDKQVTWQEVLHLARRPTGRVPMTTFTHIVRSLQSLIGPSCCSGSDLLVLTNPDVRRAFEEFYLPGEADKTRAHLLLAAHMWALADPQGNDTFLHCEADSIMHLPLHLMRSDQQEALGFLLSSFYFLYANVRRGLLHHLLETYSLYNGDEAGVEGCLGFLQRHASLLASWPALFIQQALNEPDQTPPHTWAQGLTGRASAPLVRWLNNDDQEIKQESKLVSTFTTEPTCVVVSPDGGQVVVGTTQGSLHFIHSGTGQEVKSLVSSSDGISGCLFLSEGSLVTTSFDGKIEIWDIANGCRTALIDGHTNMITGSAVSANRKNFATVSLDFTLKVWSSPKGQQVATLSSPSPLNCVTFDPEGHLLAAGCWDGAVRLWNWLQNKALVSLTGHQRAVRCVSFYPHASMLCSGCLSGEVRVWSVPTSTCVGRYQAHYGATKALAFLDEGARLLSAGSDCTLHLWSGGLGRSVTVFGEQKYEQEPPQKKQKISGPAALCVAVANDCAAVGYHGDGLKLFSCTNGNKVWSSEDFRVSVLCLLWLATEESGSGLLVSGGGDKNLRVWRRKGWKEGGDGGLELVGRFGAQQGPVLALAQNSSHLASAADDFTIALWSMKDVTSDPWAEPTVVSTLRGHSGGVTCLAFSPDGKELLSGGKDKALMVWDVISSPPVLSKSLPHSHGDWITGCDWTSNCVVSSSNDCRLRVWDLQAGSAVSEITWKTPLSCVCCLGEYVMAGCAEGKLHVWKWASGVEVSHLAAHDDRIHHCSVVPNTDESKDVVPEDMIVASASGDGTCKLWKPFQVEHHNTFTGHTGGISGVISKQEGIPEFLTVSEDCSLRCWMWETESPPSLKGFVTALCFSKDGDLLLCGYESGLLEVWRDNTLVGHCQASDQPISAMCSMLDSQFAVGCRQPAVTLWKLGWNPQLCSASLVKVTSYAGKTPVVQLCYCSLLLGILETGLIIEVSSYDQDSYNTTSNRMWYNEVTVLSLVRNDEKSMWLVGEKSGQVTLGFVFAMGPKTELREAFSTVFLERDQPEGKGSWITAITLDREFVVCGDAKGNMWYNQPPDLSSWCSRKPAHSDRISVLRLTSSHIISASHDRTVKIWDRKTKKQVGMFVCAGPVVVLDLNPSRPSEVVCGDGMGKLYFLSWRE